ncbi:uncharacterized protein LOC120005887 isoform X3 [Tripterygium wilfordii]|uniref:uncharacterized protein LOC120005887 isoform X3 n=1 Tax=Tripterygium wilfordii TaxID=458696 RepID=UPI0018F845E1|nr:uncharacterized protein LOC120005887 isoform X3 [Tripterygium wilfordii]
MAMTRYDVCPMEDAVFTLIEYLVQPLLPSTKSSKRDPPPLSQQELVAKQIHAVVILYNYYHRKQHPQPEKMEFLDFPSFSKFVVDMKPSLLAHMKLMQKSNDTELYDLKTELSLTEYMIMNACDISASLDALKDSPNIESWPVSKVTVLLVDSRKENCFLQVGSITKGVWSVIEKDVDTGDTNVERTMEGKQINKNKRSIRRTLRDNTAIDEPCFQQLAFSAVKEEAGIDQSYLTILESHVVYSLSKEKTAARFYIMECNPQGNDSVCSVPVEDAVNSLQGPLFRRDSGAWEVTKVVEYFHLLPYAGILSDWPSREVSSNSSQNQLPGSGTINVCSVNTEKPDEHFDRSKLSNGTVRCVGSKTDGSNFKSPKNAGDNSSCVKVLSDGCNDQYSMGPDLFAYKVEHDYLSNDRCVNIATEVQPNNYRELIVPCTKSDLNASSHDKVMKVDSKVTRRITDGGKLVAYGDKNGTHSSSDQVGDHALVAHESNAKTFEKLQNAIASKEKLLSQTALKVLHQKRDRLSLQLRNIEDEIARCDKDIQTILTGGEDDLALKIDSIIEGCNDACLRSVNQEKCLDDRSHHLKRKRLSEAVLNVQSPCQQELDGICYENNWMLPSYHVSASHGGRFQMFMCEWRAS